MDEEILPPQGNGGTQDRGRRLGNVECQKQPHQATIEGVQSKTVCLFASLRIERKQGLQVSNIAMVENTSCIWWFLTGALSILEGTKSQTTTKRS